MSLIQLRSKGLICISVILWLDTFLAEKDGYLKKILIPQLISLLSRSLGVFG